MEQNIMETALEYRPPLNISHNFFSEKKNATASIQENTVSSIIFDNEINSLIRFHAFTGNDYISSFYRKGKATSFKILQGSSKFQSTFATLGNYCDISDDILTKLEEFVCHSCGMRKKNANEVQFVKYYSKYQNGNKGVDISTLFPCR